MSIIAWLLAPPVELIIIVVLYMKNISYKKKIEELSRLLQMSKSQETSVQVTDADAADIVDVVDEQGSGQQENRQQENRQQGEVLLSTEEQRENIRSYEPQPEILLVYEEQERKEQIFEPAVVRDKRKPEKEGVMAMAALLIGVVFVVLAGLIFATTTWHLLPGFCKALLIAAVSLVFFTASFLAEKKLHIHKTGNAFYLLGSIFLFFTVLAAGYFQLLGPEFIWEGVNRWRVLFVGSLTTVMMMFLGVKRFRHRFYTQACFWGLTVSLFYLMAACQAAVAQFVSAMMIYGFLLILGERIGERAAKDKKPDDEGNEDKEAGFRELLTEGFGNFAVAHFWTAAFLMCICALFGLMFVPGFSPAWHSVLALSTLMAGVVLQARHGESQWIKVFFSFGTALWIHYVMMWIYRGISEEVGRTVHLGQWELCVAVAAAFVTEAAVLLCFLAGRKKNFRFHTALGDIIYTAFLGIDAFLMGMVVLIGWYLWGNGHVPCLLLAIGGILLFAAAVSSWGKEYRFIREVLPFLYLAAVLLFHEFLNYGILWEISKRIGSEVLMVWCDRGLPEFLLLVGLAVWDWRKRYGFGWSLLIIGTVAQLVCFSPKQISLPFFFLMSAYLLTKKKMPYFRAAVLYGLGGIYVLAYPFTTHNVVLRMAAVIFGYGLWMAAAVKTGREKSFKTRSVYWDVVGCMLVAGIMIAFYGDFSLKKAEWLLCLAVYGVFYWICYRGKRIWPHLLAALFILPMPFSLADRYVWTEDALYLCVIAAYLFTGVVFRRKYLICEKAEGTDIGWRVDWHHVLALLLFVPMAMGMEEIWRFVYLLLISGYFLQYCMVRPWRKAAGAAAAAVLVMAFWSQPFVTWPSIVDLEIRLLPLALYLWGTSFIWPGTKKDLEMQKDSRIRDCIRIRMAGQTVGYLGCLLVLCADAWRTNNVADALIVEGVCLLIFIGAQIYRSRFWMRISGGIMVAVVLYMTKEFWLSISWWVYLLAAGIGLIGFAAVKERKRRKSGESDD